MLPGKEVFFIQEADLQWARAAGKLKQTAGQLNFMLGFERGAGQGQQVQVAKGWVKTA